MVARTGLFVAPLPGSTPAGTSPTDGRIVFGTLFGVTPGCIGGGVLTASATAMQVGVSTAVWRIPDPTNAFGAYLSPADPYNFTFSAGPASGSRIDVLWVRQNNFEAGDADSRVTYGVAAGTAAATPVAPAIPAGAIKIAQLTVPSGASNAAACALVQTAAGGVLQPPIFAPSTTVLNTITGLYAGQRAYVGDSEYRWTSTAIWELLPTHRTLCHAVWNSSSTQGLSAAAWGAISFDTVLTDPYGMWKGGSLFSLPWAGRYSFDAKWAPNAATSSRVITEVYSNGTEYGWDHRVGAAAQSTIAFRHETSFPAGATMNLRVYFDGAANAVFGGPSYSQRPELVIRYLGNP